MGGDHGAMIVVPAAIRVIKKYPNVKLILVGQQDVLREQLTLNQGKESERLVIHHASESVGMDEAPKLALRNKKDSSMRVALNLVKNGEAQACVSAGNTGALLAIARFVLKCIPGIDKPAIIRKLPTNIGDKNVRVLDLGASVDAAPENLLQFAVMGSVLTAAVANITNPKVGLLNIGVEAIKGNELVKKSAEMLAQVTSINYIGFVEADKIYNGMVDVVVCDGFVGNVALKVTEGSAKLISNFIRQAFQRNWLTRLAGLAAIRVLLQLRKKLDPERYNGASLIGLQGIVIKSHGGAGIAGFATAIEEAIQEVKKDIPKQISSQISALLQEIKT